MIAGKEFKKHLGRDDCNPPTNGFKDIEISHWYEHHDDQGRPTIKAWGVDGITYTLVKVKAKAIEYTPSTATLQTKKGDDSTGDLPAPELESFLYYNIGNTEQVHDSSHRHRHRRLQDKVRFRRLNRLP
jgi:hypothetical protein